MGYGDPEIQRQCDYVDGMKFGFKIGVIIGVIVGYIICGSIVMARNNDRGTEKDIGRGEVQRVD